MHRSPRGTRASRLRSLALALALAVLLMQLLGTGTARADVTTTTRYEAESYMWDDVAGVTSSSNASCSNGARASQTVAGRGVVEVPVTIPADAISVTVRAHLHADTGTSITGRIWVDTDSVTPWAAPLTASTSTGCSAMTTYSHTLATVPSAGSHTISVGRGTGSGTAMRVDYIEVDIVTPDPTTTTTTASTTTTTEATTTTTAATTTTTIDPELPLSEATFVEYSEILLAANALLVFLLAAHTVASWRRAGDS